MDLLFIFLRHAVAPIGIICLGWNATPVLAAFWADTCGGTLALILWPSRGPAHGIGDWIAKLVMIAIMGLLLAPIPAVLLAWVYAVMRMLSAAPLEDLFTQVGLLGPVVAAAASFRLIWHVLKRTVRWPTQQTRRTLVPIALSASIASLFAAVCYFLRGQLNNRTLLVLALGTATIALALDLYRYFLSQKQQKYIT